jgi:hypothetical protein
MQAECLMKGSERLPRRDLLIMAEVPRDRVALYPLLDRYRMPRSEPVDHLIAVGWNDRRDRCPVLAGHTGQRNRGNLGSEVGSAGIVLHEEVPSTRADTVVGGVLSDRDRRNVHAA